jgi:ATP-dependent Clp protease ATP-binding subunit ClpC
MALHWSEASESVKATAVEASKRWKHHYLGVEHFLYAICLKDSSCRSWLGRRSLSIPDLEKEILILVPEGDEIPGWDGMPESPRLRRIITRGCQEEAEAQKSMKVEPVHILACLLREPRGVAARILKDGGTDLEAARRELLGGPVATQKGSQRSAEGGQSVEQSAEGKAKPGNEKFLKQYSRDLVEIALQGKMDPVIGRNDEVRRVLQILTRKTKSNPVLTGEAGVGKTAVALGLAQRIAAGQVPDALKNRRVLDLNLSSMIAGAKHRGEFEERLEGVVKEATADPSIILFIDEIHQLVGAGDSRGGMDASNILKPALARGDFSVLGATTTDEYRKYIEADPALERRFQPVFVDEPSEPDALEILKGLKGRYEAHHGVTFTDAALLAAVKLSVRFLPDRNLPDKAIDLIDESAARVKTRSGVFPAVGSERPIIYEVDEEVVAEVVSDWTGIPVSRMTEEETGRLLDMDNLLRQRVVGQEHAIEAVAETIRVVRVGLTSPNRPSGVFLFLGPSGVGKTELAKALAEFLFGSDKEMVRLDMSEYHDKHSMSRLIGSPPGYVGHEDEGQLTSAVRTKPYCVVLLDEVEKAHPEIFDIFLQVFDDGRLTDSKGRTVNFANTIIVLTSNLGARETIAQGSSPVQGMAGQLDQLPLPYQNALRNHFRPELLNRIDEIVVFRALEKSDLVGIIKIHLGKLISTLHDKEVELAVEQDAIDFLIEHGYQPQFGARPLQRAIHTHLSRPLAQEMLRHKAGPGSRLIAYRDGDRLAFRIAPPVGAAVPPRAESYRPQQTRDEHGSRGDKRRPSSEPSYTPPSDDFDLDAPWDDNLGTTDLGSTRPSGMDGDLRVSPPVPDAPRRPSPSPWRDPEDLGGGRPTPPPPEPPKRPDSNRPPQGGGDTWSTFRRPD